MLGPFRHGSQMQHARYVELLAEARPHARDEATDQQRNCKSRGAATEVRRLVVGFGGFTAVGLGGVHPAHHACCFAGDHGIGCSTEQLECQSCCKHAAWARLPEARSPSSNVPHDEGAGAKPEHVVADHAPGVALTHAQSCTKAIRVQDNEGVIEDKNKVHQQINPTSSLGDVSSLYALQAPGFLHCFWVDAFYDEPSSGSAYPARLQALSHC
mmetsp:Transcript_15524/g.38789  ORF Transcript_15524/g.38789 Transcript_15524/m.38789 type:complete len:213 (-) Transcript_15524:22-660(-)